LNNKIQELEAEIAEIQNRCNGCIPSDEAGCHNCGRNEEIRDLNRELHELKYMPPRYTLKKATPKRDRKVFEKMLSIVKHALEISGDKEGDVNCTLAGMSSKTRFAIAKDIVEKIETRLHVHAPSEWLEDDCTGQRLRIQASGYTGEEAGYRWYFIQHNFGYLTNDLKQNVEEGITEELELHPYQSEIPGQQFAKRPMFQWNQFHILIRQYCGLDI